MRGGGRVYDGKRGKEGGGRAYDWKRWKEGGREKRRESVRWDERERRRK